jgi:SAM-dependent methyltransferase
MGRNTAGQDIYRGFADADQATAPESLYAFLQAVDGMPEFQEYKRRLRPLLGLQQGQTVLDVGCGVGFETCRLAQEYPLVSVVGLDRAAMLAEAERRAAELGVKVRWLRGRAEAIPLPNASVDACLTERVLKYLPDPSAGIAEMVRVLKPGGRIACFELDYAATIVGGDPFVAGPVGELLKASVGDARLGRRLPGLLHDAGLVDVTFQLFWVNPPWAVYERTVCDPVRAAIADGRLAAVPTRVWQEQQAAAAALGLFTVSFVGFLVSGRRET